MTDYNKKARAVILATLMVLSVFAGTVAFSGSAAAQTLEAGNSSVTPNSGLVNDTLTHDVNITIDTATVDSDQEL
ncbi:surface glycoprotein, partial [Haloplanus sp.]|uniref:surface glycoprotein n=1 Tax=Haloplanus sp. TaxID=1961696 RepID=UPI00260CFC13